MHVELDLVSTPITLLAGIFFFLAFDSLIAFKTSLLYCFGIYVMMILKLLYESPRPFWMKHSIQALGQTCKFDFSSPSTHIFNLCFFWLYSIFMYHQKYTERANKALLSVLYLVFVGVTAFHIFGTVSMGLTYLY
mmetsp:Transcript_36909/g.56517  ORF Transcript_36909/g.56517 Transcript_36909/m.56517 type:complete len:135 (-) Transcript_36909:135-539(-)